MKNVKKSSARMRNLGKCREFTKRKTLHSVIRVVELTEVAPTLSDIRKLIQERNHMNVENVGKLSIRAQI